MKPKHKAKVNVSNAYGSRSVAKGMGGNGGSEILDFILDKKLGILVLVPGDSVESVEICEVEKGGRYSGKN